MFIQTEELSHIYMPGTPFAVQALNSVDLTIEKGGFYALAGPSGSGKSTLIQHFNGLLRATSGRVLVDNEEIGLDKAALRKLRRRIGLIFQMPEQQFFSETVFDEVAFAPRNLGMNDHAVLEKVKQSLAMVGLDYEQVKDRSPFHLSAGQKRLVAVAAVLAMGPEALILDEPAAGLDASGQEQLYNLLNKLNRNGMTVIVVTHRLGQVASLVDVLLVLNEGRLVFTGTPAQLASSPDKFAGMGLEPPPVARIMHALASQGMPVRRNLLTVEEAGREILTVLAKEAGK